MGVVSGTRRSSVVGIDIGSSLIKVVEARAGRDGIQVTAMGVAPTPPGAIDNEIVVDPVTLGQTIRGLLSESGISTKHCVSSVSGQSSVIVRIIEVPKMTPQELAETMKWEVERHVPFSASEVEMDFVPVVREDADPQDQNMEVLLAVAQQEVIGSHLDTISAAGLIPLAIDVESLASSRSLIDMDVEKITKTIAIMNVGALSSEIGIYKNGLLAFPRTIPMAGDAITRAISERLGVSLEEAERIKREQAEVIVERVQQVGSSMDLGDVHSIADFEDFEPVGALGEASDETPAEAGQAAAGGEEASSEPTAEDSAAAIPGFDVDFAKPSEEEAAPPKRLNFDLDLDSSGGEAEAPAPADIPEPAAEAAEPGAEAFETAPETQETPPAQSVDEAQTEVSPLPGVDLSAWDDDFSKEEQKDFSKEDICDAMSAVLADLVSETRRSLEYYMGRYQTQPEEIILCGGSASLKGFDKLLQSELGVQVSIANPFKNTRVFSKSLSQDYLEEVAAIFPVGLGLAIRDMIGD